MVCIQDAQGAKADEEDTHEQRGVDGFMGLDQQLFAGRE